MSLVLNKKNIEALQYEGKERCYTDTHLKGYGIRITKNQKTFYVEKRINGKPKRISLGAYPILTPEQARKNALETLSHLAQGHIPKKATASSRTESKPDPQSLADLLKNKAEAITLRHVFEDSIRTNHKIRKTSITTYTHHFRYFQDWEHLPLNHITEDMILETYQDLVVRIPQTAAYAYRYLRSLYYFAMRFYVHIEEVSVNEKIKHHLFTDNPVLVLTRNKLWTPKKQRDSVIPKKKIGFFFQSLLNIKEQTPDERLKTKVDFLLTVLLTGMRRTECASLLWENVDLEFGTISIPCSITKSGRPHLLPLSNFLWELLKQRHHKRSSNYVFPSPADPTKHLKNTYQFLEMVKRETKLQFCIHDLRRTFATTAEYVGIPATTIKRLLNHTTTGDVTAGYIIGNWDDDSLRKPMQMITDFIIGSLNQTPTTPNTAKYVSIGAKDYARLQTLAQDRGIEMSEMMGLLLDRFCEMRLVS